jgi:hypothetical protein
MKLSASTLLVTASAVAAGAQQAPQDLLLALHHRARPVLIFAAPGDPRADAQYTALQQHSTEGNQRQLHVVLISSTAAGEHHPGAAGLATSIATPAEQESLRKRFHVAADTFAVILVGKDGGEKMRSDKPVAWETLQSTIDAMPMRQTEQRGKAQ